MTWNGFPPGAFGGGTGGRPITTCSPLEALRLSALAGTPAVDVSLGGIGLFRLDVLFAIPNVTRALLDLRRPFADSSDSRDWAPHVTLLKDRPEVVLRAVPLAAERFSGHSGRIVAVSLYQFRPTRLVERIDLAP